MLEGYKVLITGATSGIGLATAKEFVENGATVIGVGRNFENTTELGGKFIPFKCDVTDMDQIKAVKAFVEKEFGILDCLISNAGKMESATPWNIESEALDDAYALHFRSHIMFVKEMLPLFKESKNPSIAITSSISAATIQDSMIGQAALQGALINYGRMTANSLNGIRCNVVCPGYIRTNILPEETWEAYLKDEELMSKIPSGRLGEAWEVAKLFTFLASEEASYVNGAVLFIDGGVSTRIPRTDILR